MSGYVWWLAAAGCSYVLGFAVHAELARRGILDRPNDRSSHKRPTVRGGGIGFITVILVGGLLLAGWRHDLSLAGILAAAAGIATISLMDDRRPVPASLRFGCHLGAALIALIFLAPWPLRLGVSPDAWTLPAWLAWPLALLWIVGHTNAFNFMDGINGIAAGQAGITASAMALLAAGAPLTAAGTPGLLAALVGGAAAGFLPHNFPKARMFMGDVGSAPLGFLLALLVLAIAHERGAWLLLPLGLLHANFVLDTAITLVRRVLRGEAWHQAHREHFYQRLIRAGRSHTLVTTSEMALQTIVVVLMLLWPTAPVGGRWLLLFAVLAIWGAFFLHAEHALIRATTRA